VCQGYDCFDTVVGLNDTSVEEGKGEETLSETKSDDSGRLVSFEVFGDGRRLAGDTIPLRAGWTACNEGRKLVAGIAGVKRLELKVRPAHVARLSRRCCVLRSSL
jgi:hypothetical protein